MSSDADQRDMQIVRQEPNRIQQDSLFAEEEQRIALQQSNVAGWLLMPPTAGFVSGLSASAIEIYEQCPLRFKLEREWNLPREVPASLHYGTAMHAVLRTFYDAQRYGREIGDEDLLEQFRASLAGSSIADRYQYELYLRQGIEQLRQFLDCARNAPMPDVMETEHRFELQVGGAKVTGRVDRIDRTGTDTVAIVDYKTGKPKSQDDADESLQLSLYALAAKETLGKVADRLVLHNIENNVTVSTTRSVSASRKAMSGYAARNSTAIGSKWVCPRPQGAVTARSPLGALYSPETSRSASSTCSIMRLQASI